jgi:hypothetical protein
MKRLILGAFMVCLVVVAGAGWLLAVQTFAQQRATASALAAANSRAEELASELADSTSELERVKTERATTGQKLGECQEQLSCGATPPEIDYTSNATASQSLKKHVENTRGSVDDADWEVLWANSQIAIHRLWGKYLYIYIVSFDDPELGNRAWVFDVEGRCFLDR